MPREQIRVDLDVIAREVLRDLEKRVGEQIGCPPLEMGARERLVSMGVAEYLLGLCSGRALRAIAAEHPKGSQEYDQLRELGKRILEGPPDHCYYEEPPAAAPAGSEPRIAPAVPLYPKRPGNA
jgi:hypothetical protein